MFYRNRIKQLEDKIDALEVQVAEILAITSKYYQAVDILLAQKKEEEAKGKAEQEVIKPAPRLRRRQRKNNGKENPKAGE
jgi:hypothetical protein